MNASSRDWTEAEFAQYLLFGRLTSDEVAGTKAMELAYTALLNAALEVIRPSRRGPCAYEVASEALDLLIAGRLGRRFDSTRAFADYLRGLLRRLAAGYDGKHRRRGEVSLNDIGVDRASGERTPIQAVLELERLAEMRLAWDRLSTEAQHALRAQLGLIFHDGGDVDAPSKNYGQKHRAVRQLQRLLGVERPRKWKKAGKSGGRARPEDGRSAQGRR